MKGWFVTKTTLFYYVYLPVGMPILQHFSFQSFRTKYLENIINRKRLNRNDKTTSYLDATVIFIRERRSQDQEKSLRIIGNPQKIEYDKQQEITKERYKEEGGKGLLKLEITFPDTHSESSLTNS